MNGVSRVQMRPEPEDLRRALASADLRVLLMCLFHLTGDRRWLEAPYRPERDVRLIADPTAGFDVETQRQIRAAAFETLSRSDAVPAIGDPGADLLGEMMTTCLGEAVDPEYVDVVRVDMGFGSADAVRDAQASEGRSRLRVLIVGAGVSGLALAVKLEELGIDYTVVDKNSDIGGTWFENRYPGCRVDTPSHFYSYSFAPNHGWPHYFSTRDAVHRYLSDVAESSGVQAKVRLATHLVGAEWRDETSCWEVTLVTASGAVLREQFAVVVSAIGQLNLPAIPSIPGMTAFAGPLFHSARWPDDLSLGDKRVAVIGTGASAMQIVPSVADEVAALDVYQRSPQWVRPVAEYQQEVEPATQWLLERVPFYATWYRFTLLWRFGDGLLRSLRKDPTWPHPERSVNRTNDRHRDELTRYIEQQLACRPDLIASCVPTYPPYGKRILIDCGWYRTITRPHIRLITDAIDHFEADGVVTADGQFRPADVVVLATGFTVTDLTARLRIVGRAGLRLEDAWVDENPTAYLGITVPQFPNLFLMYGPNTNLAHGGSIIFHAECQARYISKLLVQMEARDLVAVECRQDRHDEYVRRVDAEHEQLVWTHPGMTTWYRNRYRRVVSVSPWRLVDYWHMTREPQLDDLLLTARAHHTADVRS